MIALLAFILGIWLWDHYFGKSEGYAPGTEEIALVKIDRDLRLADAMQEDPPWLKLLAGVSEPVEARRAALGVFKKLAVEKALTPLGVEAFSSVKAEQEGLPLETVLAENFHEQGISDPAEIVAKLTDHRGTWWDAKWIESREGSVVLGSRWREAYGADLMQLKNRAVATGFAVWLLGLVGLAFVPNAILCMARGLSAKPKGYAKAWPLSLGLVIFLVATLAWIGFNMTLELGIGALPGLHPGAWIFLDSAARMLPALIALALLFRRPSHAIRVMGLNRPMAVKALLGTFSLLMILDRVLRSVMQDGGSSAPGGGLSLADAGLWGLAFAVVSACVLAPVAEELLYRGVLFSSCRNRLGVIAAALMSSAVFAVLHFYDGYGLASVGIFGLSCAFLYAGTGSLRTVIALHMLYNTAIKIPEWIVYHAPLG